MNKTLATLILSASMLSGCANLMPKVYLNAPEAKGYDVMLYHNRGEYGTFMMQLGERDGIGSYDGSLSIFFRGDNGNVRSYELTCNDLRKDSPLEKMTVDSLIVLYHKLNKR